MDLPKSRSSESEITHSPSPSMMEREFTDVQPLGGSRLGYALVYKAKRMGKWHVLKCLKPEYIGNPMYESLLRKEFDIAYPLSSPNIAQVLGLEEVPSLGLCIVEEYVDGHTLRSLIDNNAFDKKAKAEHIVTGICDALSYIHARQITHRDLKPENIMVTDNGMNVKLIDFGFSDTDDFAVLKQPAGTLRYVAPEQARGERVDARADIYSLGVIIGELNSALSHSSARLRRMAKKCSREDATKRYQSADDVKAALTYRSHLVNGGFMVAVPILCAALMYVLYFRNYTKQVGKPAIQQVQPADSTNRKDIGGETEKPSSVPNTDETKAPKSKSVDMVTLEKTIKEATLKLQQETFRALADTTMPAKESLHAYETGYQRAEEMVRRNVDELFPANGPKRIEAQTQMHEAMRLTFKQYNLDNMPRLLKLLREANDRRSRAEK